MILGRILLGRCPVLSSREFQLKGLQYCRPSSWRGPVWTCCQKSVSLEGLGVSSSWWLKTEHKAKYLAQLRLGEENMSLKFAGSEVIVAFGIIYTEDQFM